MAGDKRKARFVPSLSSPQNRVFASPTGRWFVEIPKDRPSEPSATSGDDWFAVSRREAADLLTGRLG